MTMTIMGIGDWGLGIGDWGLGPIPKPQSPIPHPQTPNPLPNICPKNFYKQKKNEVKKQKRINDNLINGELGLTNKDIKKHRFFQLKDLYLTEMKQFEKELNDV